MTRINRLMAARLADRRRHGPISQLWLRVDVAEMTQWPSEPDPMENAPLRYVHVYDPLQWKWHGYSGNGTGVMRQRHGAAQDYGVVSASERKEVAR